jgi:hypothetical protein
MVASTVALMAELSGSYSVVTKVVVREAGLAVWKGSYSVDGSVVSTDERTVEAWADSLEPQVAEKRDFEMDLCWVSVVVDVKVGQLAF